MKTNRTTAGNPKNRVRTCRLPPWATWRGPRPQRKNVARSSGKGCQIVREKLITPNSPCWNYQGVSGVLLGIFVEVTRTFPSTEVVHGTFVR